MLIKAHPEDVTKYCDTAYQLALDQTKSCYPTYADGIKSRADFIAAAQKSASGETSELLLFFQDATMEGWIGYFWIPQEHYLQLNFCNIAHDTQTALWELLTLLKERFSGYTFYFGFPEENTDAIRFLQKNDFKCVEEDWNHSFFFAHYDPLPACQSITRINRENFDDYRAVCHTEEETYWNCDRILESLDDWVLYAYYQNGTPVGAVSLRGSDRYYEIFGIDFADNIYQEHICRALLTAALNHCKHSNADYLTFFCEEEQRQLLQELGFSCVGKYVCYLRNS